MFFKKYNWNLFLINIRCKWIHFNYIIMKIKFRLDNIKLSDSEKDYIKEKFDKLAEKSPRINNEATVIEVEVARNIDKQVKEDVVKVVIKMSVPHHEMIRSWANGSDVIAVFDKARNKLKTQVVKYQKQFQ